MKRFPHFLFILALAFALPAFAQQQDIGGPNYETRLSMMEEQLRAINGQIEQLGYAIRRLDQNTQRLQSDEDARLARLENTVASLASAAEARAAAPPVASVPPVAQPAAPTSAVVVPPTEGTLGALKTQQNGRVTGAVSNPQAPPLPDVPPGSLLTPQEQYERAFGLLRNADYENAEKAFKDFIDRNPKDKLIENAKYWHAEALYVRGHFAEAATAFADAFQQNPQGMKAADSLLKLAMSLEALNKTSDACTALAQLKEKYPAASANVKTRAAEERSKLKCSN